MHPPRILRTAWHQKAAAGTNERDTHVTGCIIKVVLRHVCSELPQCNMTSCLISI